MAKKEKKPSWFKLWLHHRPLIDAVPDDVAGRVLKAAMRYLATGEVMPLGQLEMVAFASIKSDIDEANADYLRDVENGKKGGRPRLTNEEKPPVKGGDPPHPSVTEGEREGEGEREREGEDIKAGKLPARQRFSPPTANDVRLYCQEQGYSVDAERFVDHYESNGWMVGKNKMKDWKAAVRNWNRKETPNNGKTEPKQVWPTIGTVV